LVAALLAALLVGFWPPGEREPRLRQIGRITLYTLVGTVVGLLMMACLCLPMMKF
jgi:hypothetical protein